MWLLLVQCGFVGFGTSMLGLLWRGFAPDGGTRRGAWLWGGAALGFFLLMCFALPRVPRP